MAKTEQDIQNDAMKLHGFRATSKAHKAMFGTSCYADGGAVEGKYTPQPKTYGVANPKLPFRLADGGMVGNAAAAIRGRGKQIDDAEMEMVKGPQKPAEPQTPAPTPVKAPEAPKKGLLARMFGMASGGEVCGPGGPTDDKVPAMLSNGEYVLPADTVKAIGKDKLDAIKAATHTPVKARFGMANGGIPGYDVEEIPDIEGKDLTPEQLRQQANPALRDPKVQQRIAQANRIGSALPAEGPAPAAAPAAEAAAESPVKNVLGRAASAAGRVVDAVKAPFNVLGGVARVAASPITAGAALALHSADAGAQSDVLTDPQTGAVTNVHQGNAMSPQFAAMSDTDKYKLLTERNDPNTPPARVAELDAMMKGAPAQVSPATKYVAPSASFGTPGISAQDEAPSTSSAVGQQPVVSDEDRGAFVRGEGGPNVDRTQYQNLGNYGVPGQAIFGRATGGSQKLNDFVGVGSGGPQKNGVDFGITPEQLAAYKAAQNAQPAAQMPSAPQYIRNEQLDKINSQVAQLSDKLSHMGPGTLGRGAVRRQINTLLAVQSGLQQQDAQRNAFNESQFGRAQQQFNTTADRAIRERELTLGHAAQLGSIEAQRYGSKLQFDEAMARLGNEKENKTYERNQQARDTADKTLRNAGVAELGDTPEGKQLGSELAAHAMTRKFQTKQGEKYFWELNDRQRANVMGTLRNEVEANRRAKAGGLPTSGQGTVKFGSPSVLGYANSLVHSPIDTLRYGANQVEGGNFLTAAPAKLPSVEAYENKFGTAAR